MAVSNAESEKQKAVSNAELEKQKAVSNAELGKQMALINQQLKMKEMECDFKVAIRDVQSLYRRRLSAITVRQTHISMCIIFSTVTHYPFPCLPELPSSTSFKPS
jgi:hypothetical protein